MGSNPGSSKGLVQHFQCKIPPNFVLLFYFITHSSYKFSPIEKRRRDTYMPPFQKWGYRGQSPSPRKLQGFTANSMQNTVYLLCFNTFFLKIFSHRKKVCVCGGGGDQLHGPSPCLNFKKSGLTIFLLSI